MRPYLAIIKDSFRAALASRVLYVLLGLIVLVLLALAPLHVRESLDTKLDIDELDQLSLIAQRIVERKDDPARPGSKRIWESFPENVRTQLQEYIDNGNSETPPAASVDKTKDKEDGADDESSDSRGAGRRPGGRRGGGGSNGFGEMLGVLTALNETIEDTEFYRAEDWEGSLDSEATALVDQGVDNLTDEQKKRLNRILIGRELSMGTGARTAVSLQYAVWPITTLSQTHQQFAAGLTAVVPFMLDKVVLSIGLLIAILVTANIMPETLEAGTLNLLFSKPISRSGLYISKFLGGCAFVAICATLLFFGLWLWLGLGLRIWERSILISIPLYLLVFAIYFSVSAFVGLTSRSVILSIVATAVFWAACFGIGSTYFFFDNRMENREIREVAMAPGGGVLASTQTSMVSKWNDKKNDWEVDTDSDLNEQEKMLIQVTEWGGGAQHILPKLQPVQDFGSGNIVISRSAINDNGLMGPRDIMIAKSIDDSFKKIGVYPREVIQVMQTDQQPVVVKSNGEFLRLVIDGSGASTTKDESKTPDDDAPTTPTMASWSLESIGPDAPVYANAGALDLNVSNQEIAAYSAGVVSVFSLQEDGQYSLKHSVEVDTGARKSMSCRVAYQGDTIVLALGNGQIITLDGPTLKEKKGYLPESKFGITSVRGSWDGRWFAFSYRNEFLWLLDTENEATMFQAKVKGQGSISAVSFTADNQMIIGDRTDRVTTYDLPDFKAVDTFSPGGTMLDKSYRYAIRPLYKVCPKPGEFYKVVSHLSATNDTKRNPNVDLRTQDSSTDPWSPLISGLVFMFGMLALSCFVFWRTDY